MTSKIKETVILILALFFGGNLFVFIGLAKGHDVAAILSRPIGASAWSTSEELIAACTYTPVILGCSLITVSIVFSTVCFINWTNNLFN